MKLCDDVITVFRQAVDPATKTVSLSWTVIRGAHWFATAADTVDPKGGLVAANKVVVRIPAENMPGGLKISKGDLIVRGEAAGQTEAELRRTYGADFAVVLSVTDSLGAPKGPHLKIVGT